MPNFCQETAASPVACHWACATGWLCCWEISKAKLVLFKVCFWNPKQPHQTNPWKREVISLSDHVWVPCLNLGGKISLCFGMLQARRDLWVDILKHENQCSQHPSFLSQRANGKKQFPKGWMLTAYSQKNEKMPNQILGLDILWLLIQLSHVVCSRAHGSVHLLEAKVIFTYALQSGL